MGFSNVKAAIAGALLFVPTAVMADPLFSGAAPSADFQLFPFWKKVLVDMAQATPASPAPQLQSVAFANTALALEPGTPAPADRGCADERHCIPAIWTDFLAGLKGLNSRAQMEAVNRWANARPYVEDIANWNLPDYWETPGEFIAHGGDCEDFAIAKYFSLVRLGFPARDLRITIVSDSRAHDFHAVLVANIDGMEWLLDNQIAEMVPLASQPQYTPVYALNEEGWWLQSRPVIQVAANFVITIAPAAAAPAATAPAPVMLAKAD
jgi:predicted transglutaminase-like cysteine proteinase